MVKKGYRYGIIRNSQQLITFAEAVVDFFPGHTKIYLSKDCYVHII